MRLRRVTLFLAALVLVSVGVTASVALGSRTGSSPIEQAATKSATASSLKFDFTLGIAGGTIQTGTISLGGTGAIDSKHKAADFKLDLGSLAPLLSGVTKGASVPKSIELVVVSNALYLNFPALAKQLAEEPEFHGEIGFEVAVIVQMVARDVGECSRRDIDAVEAVLIQTVA
jgi:hypothetical protein